VNALWPVLACLAFSAASPETLADVPQKYLEGLPFPMGDIREPAFPPRSEHYGIWCRGRRRHDEYGGH